MEDTQKGNLFCPKKWLDKRVRSWTWDGTSLRVKLLLPSLPLSRNEGKKQQLSTPSVLKKLLLG